jgi:SAM-dependent methyltransferase
MDRPLSVVDRAAYRTQQAAFALNTTLFQQTARVFARAPRPKIDSSIVRQVRARFAALLDRDLDNVARGDYPRELLFQIPARRYLRQIPSLVRDAPGVVRRMRKGDYRDLPDGVDLSSYPPYYRRTFHWQTDGYLSRRSAALYDVGVELLFRGTADVMRRQIIPPITRFIAGGGGAAHEMRLLDVGCGTGRALRQIATAHPSMKYFGIDLSPYYIGAARRLTRDVEHATLLADNAERLPFVDGHFDVITSVYLFHELPRNARRNVLREAHRALRPGGLLVLEDSAQPSDSPGLAEVLEQFQRDFHEPFYRDYLRDDLAELATECGFEVESSEPHLVAKVVVAHKPAL